MTELFVGHLADTLLDIGRTGKTGMLRVTSAGRMRLAFFEAGKLVYLVSDVPEENLGDYFTRTGRIENPATRLELSLLEKEVSRKKSLVSLILERRIIEPNLLREWLIEYAYESLARAFDTREGQAKLAPGMQADHPLPFEVTAEGIILEAVRRMRDDTVVRDAIGPLDQIASPSAEAPWLTQTLPLSFYDGLVATQATEEMPIENLVIISGLNEMDVLRAVLALRLTGVLQPFKAPKVTSDTDKLRMRLEALESGLFVDAGMAAVAYEMTANTDEDGISTTSSAISMGEFSGATSYVPPPPPPQAPVLRASTGPLQAPQLPRGDTSRLRVLSTAYVQMGEAEAAAGNFAAAIQCFESALKQNPKDLDTLVALGKLLAKRPGGFANAEKTLRKAISTHPTKVRPLVELAQLYRDNGREDLAEAQIAEARRLDPADPLLKSYGLTKSKGAGLFASMFGRGEVKKPSTQPPPSGVRQPRPVQPIQPQSGEQRNCRYCHRPSPKDARACRYCGAAM